MGIAADTTLQLESGRHERCTCGPYGWYEPGHDCTARGSCRTVILCVQKGPAKSERRHVGLESARPISGQRFHATPNSSIKTKDPAQFLDVTDRLNVVHRHLDSAILIDHERRPDGPVTVLPSTVFSPQAP